MNFENFTNAITIISKNHTSEILINKPITDTVGDLGTKDFTIHIVKCCAKVTENLIKSGYSLDMDKYGLSVQKY